MTAPAACAACNHHVSCLSTAIDAAEAAIQTPGIRPPLDDTFRTAQTDRGTTQLLAPGERPSPSQLKQPSRRGCGAVPSRWASRVVPGASGGAEEARGTAQSKFTKICPLHTGPLPSLPAARIRYPGTPADAAEDPRPTRCRSRAREYDAEALETDSYQATKQQATPST